MAVCSALRGKAKERSQFQYYEEQLLEEREGKRLVITGRKGTRAERKERKKEPKEKYQKSTDMGEKTGTWEEIM